MPFRNITGHRHLLTLMARAAGRGSLPPSLIFAGPEGVGKRMAAVALAQFFNCLARRDVTAAVADGSGADMFGPSRLHPGTDVVSASELGSGAPATDACGECAACRRIARGVHADILLIEPDDSGSIKIDAIRDAVGRTVYRPFEGRRRVIIVDGAHEVQPQAQDALLKTLEEPPPASAFVLVTSRPDALPATIRSRCQCLRFGRLAPADVAAVLIREHGFSEADAFAAAALGDGSIGAALEGGTDEAAEAREAAGRLLEGVAASSDPRRRLESAKALLGAGKEAKGRDELTRRLHAVSSILRDLGVLLSRADERCLANADLKPLLAKLLRSYDGERALRAFSAVDRALEALDRNASPKIVADWLAFQI